MEKLIWHTEFRKVNELIPFDKNPRKLTKNQKDQLIESLEKFNLVEIPAIDNDNKIIAGHMRCKILQELGQGEKEIEVRMPNRKLTKEEFNEYNLRSNKNIGEWDFDLLSDFDLDFLKKIGFEETELIGDLSEKLEQKKEEIKFYKKVHILISINLENFKNVESYINEIFEKLKNIQGVEIEQSSN